MEEHCHQCQEYVYNLLRNRIRPRITSKQHGLLCATCQCSTSFCLCKGCNHWEPLFSVYTTSNVLARLSQKLFPPVWATQIVNGRKNFRVRSRGSAQIRWRGIAEGVWVFTHSIKSLFFFKQESNHFKGARGLESNVMVTISKNHTVEYYFLQESNGCLKEERYTIMLHIC